MDLKEFVYFKKEQENAILTYLTAKLKYFEEQTNVSPKAISVDFVDVTVLQDRHKKHLPTKVNLKVEI